MKLAVFVVPGRECMIMISNEAQDTQDKVLDLGPDRDKPSPEES